MKLLAALLVALAFPAAALAEGTRLVAQEVPLRGERSLAGARPSVFHLVGLHWQGPGAVAFRTRSTSGRWSAWRDAQPSPLDLPDAGTDEARSALVWKLGNPYWVGASNAIQYRLRGSVTRLRAHFVVSRAKAVPVRTLSIAGSPLVAPRSSWGANEAIRRGGPFYAPALRFGVVHHTAGSNNYTAAQSAAIVRAIQTYHVKGNGWNDIGYNFLVDKYGQVFEGRAGGIDQPVVGAQAQGYNSVSTGIACLGDFSSIAQTPEGMDVLARLIGWKLSLHAVPTSGAVTVISAGGESNRYSAGTPVTFERISGHRDGNNTACPGNVLYTQLDELRSAAAQFAGPALGLSLYAAREIRGVKPADVSGTLRFPDGSAATGAAIVVEYLRSGTSEWTTLASTVAGPDGSWSATVEFPFSGRVRAVFPGDATRARLESPPRRVTVLARLTISLNRRRLRLGQRARLTGAADPATHVRLTVQRRGRRRWVRHRRRLVRVRSGLYRARVRPPRSGKYRITAKVGRIKRRRTIKVF